MNINTKLNKLGLLMIEKYLRIRIGNEIGTWLGTGNWTGFGDIIGTEIGIVIRNGICTWNRKMNFNIRGILIQY